MGVFGLEPVELLLAEADESELVSTLSGWSEHEHLLTHEMILVVVSQIQNNQKPPQKLVETFYTSHLRCGSVCVSMCKKCILVKY